MTPFSMNIQNMPATIPMVDLLCIWNNHAVDALQAGNGESALAILAEALDVLPLYMVTDPMKQQLMQVFGANIQSRQADRDRFSLHVGTAEFTTSQKSFQDTLVFNKAIVMKPVAPNCTRTAAEEKYIVSYQVTIILFNTALANHVIASKYPAHAEISMRKALNLYKIAFDNLLVYLDGLNMASPSGDYDITELKFPVMFMAIVNNSSLLHYELGRHDLAKGCMDQLSSILVSLPDGESDKNFFLLNTVMLESTHGSAAA